MNIWNGIGNLTRDPELKYSNGANQTAVCRFSVAINDGYGEKQTTDYINIVTFGKTAENCDRFLRKGNKVAIQGRIKTGSYERDGKKVYTTDVIGDRIEFLSKPEGKAEAPAQEVPQGFSTIDEDVPF